MYKLTSTENQDVQHSIKLTQFTFKAEKLHFLVELQKFSVGRAFVYVLTYPIAICGEREISRDDVHVERRVLLRRELLF